MPNSSPLVISTQQHSSPSMSRESNNSTTCKDPTESMPSTQTPCSPCNLSSIKAANLARLAGRIYVNTFRVVCLVVLCRHGSLVTDCTVFRCLWSDLNHFRTSRGFSAPNVVHWRQCSDPTGEQTVKHIVDVCPLTKFPGSLQACVWLMTKLLIGSHARHDRRRSYDVSCYNENW